MWGKKAKIASLCSLLVLALSSCSGSAQTTSPSLEGVKYALYFSPPSLFLNDFSVFTPNHGYVLLIDEEGGHQAIKTDGMDGGEVIWGSAHELSFADQSHNYIVGEQKIEKFEAPKTDLQNDIAVSNGTYLSTFNLGGKRGEYKNQFTLTDAHGNHLETITESIETIATCPDGKMIGGGKNRGPTLDLEENTSSQILISQVFDGQNLSVKPLWNHTASEWRSTSLYGLVCTTNNFYALMYSPDNENISDISLVSVDISSGESEIKPLISDETYTSTIYTMGPDLYNSRYLDWFTPDYFYRTDILTGETHRLLNLEGYDGGRKVSQNEVEVDEDFIYQLVELPGDGDQYAIHTYARSDGALVDQLELDPIKGVGGMGQYGFAVRPSP
ncbi:hypothetical protein QM007_03130 [Rothia sp. SD9660Na]|uniref:hypothetical protein n=1 Tax=Rothia sp. SD9660Na TaxID=3047030 RepID=UPI0024BB8AC3|nr:hypothetical protein [Rothia sp. SD9660Na]WHS50981.1 hypothetical protein QM007_03130 [Rothia sp. SD9660Na]